MKQGLRKNKRKIQCKEEYECNVAALKAENDDEELWNGSYRETMFSEEYYRVDMFNEARNGGSVSQKRKAWMQDANVNSSKFANIQTGDSSRSNDMKRKRGTGEQHFAGTTIAFSTSLVACIIDSSLRHQ
ncbi:hypothetical protein Bca52824_002341 [Brassica carinata]|uniref:Uncharacterized protein n=1 Tax=Brassica carinata TaxID=52824 RepID=A0A8X7WKH4_BRACI|nr:hypothetical protein Bca52824_002341 [Brassica carinata]